MRAVHRSDRDPFYTIDVDGREVQTESSQMHASLAAAAAQQSDGEMRYDSIQQAVVKRRQSCRERIMSGGSFLLLSARTAAV